MKGAFIIGLIMFVIGLGCVVAAAVMQVVLAFQIYGVWIQHAVIGHWSLWLNLGVLPMIVGGWMVMKEE